ncbi:hypothetical protein ACLKA6_009946 [Drosophila palustris]
MEGGKCGAILRRDGKGNNAKIAERNNARRENVNVKTDTWLQRLQAETCPSQSTRQATQPGRVKTIAADKSKSKSKSRQQRQRRWQHTPTLAAKAVRQKSAHSSSSDSNSNSSSSREPATKLRLFD